MQNMRYEFLYLIVFISCVLILGCKSEASEQKEIQENKVKPSFLIVDLDGDGPDILPLEESQVYFDVDGDGLAERTAWVNTDDGFLFVPSREEASKKYSVHGVMLSYLINLLNKVESYDDDNNFVYDQNDYIDIPNLGLVPDIGFSIVKDRDLDGIPEIKNRDMLRCNLLRFEYQKEVKSLVCEGKTYDVYETFLDYEDANLIWKKMCYLMMDQFHRSENTKSDYKRYCLDMREIHKMTP